MKIKYFAWIRQHINLEEEDLELPDHVNTVAELIEFLKHKSDGHAKAFDCPELVRCAIDLTFCNHDASIKNIKEIAFFPPVTGG
ncbi:MAG: molybdopterin converting factor subunit 1 [Pseudomonadota bacterium]